MRPTSHRLARHAGVALVLCATAAPGAVAQSPDAIDNNLKARAGQARELMSPDARALNDAHGVTPTAPPRVIQISRSDGLDAGDVAIGAGGAIGVVLLAGGAAVTVSRRRHPAQPV